MSSPVSARWSGWLLATDCDAVVAFLYIITISSILIQRREDLRVPEKKKVRTHPASFSALSTTALDH